MPYICSVILVLTRLVSELVKKIFCLKKEVLSHRIQFKRSFFVKYRSSNDRSVEEKTVNDFFKNYTLSPFSEEGFIRHT